MSQVKPNTLNHTCHTSHHSLPCPSPLLPPPPPKHTQTLHTDAYRNAVALSPRDYRAWYGLGQTYELLCMPHYALHYYRCVKHQAKSQAVCLCVCVAACVFVVGVPHYALHYYRCVCTVIVGVCWCVCVHVCLW